MKLLYYPDESLKTYCHEVTEFGEALVKELDQMTEIMLQNNGLGLAANQVGLIKRMFVMRDFKGKIWHFVNPVIIFDDGIQLEDEGCLSFKGLALQIQRAKQVSVKAVDGNGVEFHVAAVDREAICIQHEIEHLNGKMYIDNLPRQQKRDAIKRIKK